MTRLLLGIAAGAAIGVLFAPDKGEETRKKLMEKKDDFLHDLEDHFADLKERLNKGVNAMKKEVDNMADTSTDIGGSGRQYGGDTSTAV